MKKQLFFTILGLLVLSFSCKKNENPPSNTTTSTTSTTSSSTENNFIIELQANGVKYNLGETVVINNKRIKLNVFMFLMNKPSFVSGTENKQIQDIMLIDMDPNIEANSPNRDKQRVGNQFKLTNFSPTSGFSTFNFGLGGPSEVNGEVNKANYKPGSYLKGHPLAYGMGIDWDVWKMYRHIRIEGFCDSASTTTLRYPIKWHTGFDSLYIPTSYKLGLDNSKLKLIININTFFEGSNPIELPKEKYTEMGKTNAEEGRIGVKISQNLVKAISL